MVETSLNYISADGISDVARERCCQGTFLRMVQRSPHLLPPTRQPEVFLLEMESGFQCAACGEWNVTSVDESAGRRQTYVEDCQVCCKPNVLHVEYDISSQEFVIAAQQE